MSKTKVVILNWNGRAHLERFLPSVVGMTPPEVCIVVADNGSDDDSCSFVESSHPQVEIIRLGYNYGFAEGYNRALSLIEADYCILLNSDVETTPNWCEPLIETIENDRHIAAVSPKILSYIDRTKFDYAGAAGGFIDMLGYPFCRGRIMSCIEKDTGQYDDARDVFWTSGACMIVRTEMFRELGGFDGDFFAHMEEIDFCWRAQLAGYKIRVQPASWIYHLGGGTLSSTSPRKTYLNFRNNLAMLYKNLPQNRLWYIMFIRAILDGASAAIYFLQGKRRLSQAVVTAYADFRKMKGKLHEKRASIRKGAIREPDNIYNGSIVVRYMLGNRKFRNMM